MKRFLIGVDGSERSQPLVRWAADLATPLDAELLALHAWLPPRPGISIIRAGEMQTDAAQLLESIWAAPARELGVPITTEVAAGDPAEMLLDVGDREDVDLIVVGTRGSGGFPGLRLGSVADFIAHRTSRPLAVVPEDGEGGKVGRIIVGVDGSRGAHWAVAFAAELAEGLDAEVTAVYAFRPPLEWVPESDPRSWKAHALRGLNGDWTRPLAEVGVPVTRRVVEDNHVAPALISTAADVGADLIIVGTRDVTGLLAMRLGGVTMNLLHHSPLPVIIVPPVD